MHRKFIAFIVATAIAITGISASQAQAADTRDVLGGLAAIAIIGAAVNHYQKEKKRDEEAERRKRHKRAEAKAKKAKKKYKVRPLPDRVARYDLPHRCLRTFDGYGNKRQLLGPNCLKKHYRHADSLPNQCKVGFWNGNKVRRAYEPACLRQKGYRVVYQ